jgi:hypothetical protein
MSYRRHQLGFDHRLGTKKETITFLLGKASLVIWKRVCVHHERWR